MFSTGVTRKLNARHYLVGDFGDESVPHAHPYEVELICRSRDLDENGFSTDIAAMEEALESCIAQIDDVLLNDLPAFEGKQPSLENLAIYLVAEIRSQLASVDADAKEPLEIRIWESRTAWAAYSESGG